METPTVVMTEMLRQRIEGQGEDPGLLLSDFAEWKEDWPKYEYGSAWFGKDSAYSLPTVGGHKNTLKHAHLRPLSGDPGLDAWEKDFKHRSRKTSDSCLIYAEKKPTGPYFLIAILDAPGAHDVAKMQNRIDQEFMEGLAQIADDWLSDGKIVC